MLTNKQAERIMDDAKRIALVTQGFQCLSRCLRDKLKCVDEDMSMMLECMDVKSMLISGLGNSLYDDLKGMTNYNETNGG